MTLLHQMLDHQNMCEAWEAVAENNGMPGVDGIPIKKWRRSWEENLVNLERDVRKYSYKPSKLRTCRIHKSDHREFRTLKIPTVKDRFISDQYAQSSSDKTFRFCRNRFRKSYFNEYESQKNLYQIF